MINYDNTYWNHKGRYQSLVEPLQKLLPVYGESKSGDALEKFRKASNVYYDLYNNGLCNCAAEFRAIFGIASSKHRENHHFTQELYDSVEGQMDKLILEAAAEQLSKRAA